MKKATLQEKIIQRLKRLEQKCFSGRRRFQFYQYLSALLDYHQQLEAAGQLINVRDRLLRTPACTGTSADPIRVLIDATSSANAKAKSRWTKALQYALDYRESWMPRSTLVKFFRVNGGVAGCARRGAARRPRKGKCAREPEMPEMRDWR